MSVCHTQRVTCGPSMTAADRGRLESPMMTGHLQQDPSSQGRELASIRLSQIKYMEKMPTFQANKPAQGQSIGSWPEWKQEFEQNAKLCCLDKEVYYSMVQTLLSSAVRDSWLGTIKGKPQMANWGEMDKYFTAPYSSKDTRSEAEAKLSSTVLKEDTEAAWHSYVSTQTKSISDTGGKGCT